MFILKTFPPIQPIRSIERERMEIEGEDGTKLPLNPTHTTIFGRKNGFQTGDTAVSRRHVSFTLIPASHKTNSRISFEVLGKNPIWVRSKEDGRIRVFKRFERGEMGIDDMFCVCGKEPVWFALKEERESGLSQSLESDSGFDSNRDLGLDCVDVSGIDPVTEFGFLVIGHEFDQYPKLMIRDISSWDWFLDDPRKDGDNYDDDLGKTRKRVSRGKRKKTPGDDDFDEEWTGESEEDNQLLAKTRKISKPKYHTRSKDRDKARKRTKSKTSSAMASAKEEEEDVEDEDEEDETLGGFVVDDDVEGEGGDDEDEEEEEEFEEDEDDDD